MSRVLNCYYIILLSNQLFPQSHQCHKGHDETVEVHLYSTF
jgi:hypothetical protein